MLLQIEVVITMNGFGSILLHMNNPFQSVLTSFILQVVKNSIA